MRARGLIIELLKGKAMPKTIEGSCLCGKVRYEVSEPFENFYLCHCNRCRKATGSAHAANIFASLNSLTWLSGEGLVKEFELSNENNFNKCFCTECGSSVPVRANSGAFYIIPAGTLNGEPSMQPLNNIFWEKRACWYEQGLQANKCSGYPE